MSPPSMRLLLLCGMLLLTGTAEAAAANERAGPPGPAQPSANRGRLGTYQATTSFAAYNYYVCVPKAYDADHPAGLHLFFHGNNNHGAAKEFERWSPTFLEPFDLIGLNMEFTDDDNFKDQDNKLKATQQAIAQVCADYKVIIPRGAVTGFSAGGGMEALLADTYGRTRSPQWPFCHCTSLSSSWDHDPTLCVPMSWCFVAGTEEWSFFNIGNIAVKRTGELYQATAKGGTPDIRFLATHQGHTIADSALKISAASFALSDLAYAAFLYVPDYAEKELRPLVEQANHQQPAQAAAALAKLLAKPTLAEPLRAKAQALQAVIEARLAKVVAMLAELDQGDPVLATWYGPLLLAQLKGEAREKDLKTAFAAMAKSKEVQTALAAHAEYAKQFPTLFGPNGGNPGVVPDKRPILTMLGPRLPATSRAAIIIAELLALTP